MRACMATRIHPGGLEARHVLEDASSEGGATPPAVKGVNGATAKDEKKRSTGALLSKTNGERGRFGGSFKSLAAVSRLAVRSPSLSSLSSTSTRHLRQSSARAVKDARGGASVKSRTSLGVGITTLYFYVLERSWAFCAFVFTVALVAALAVSTAACVVVGGYEDPYDSPTAPLRFAASHIVTMGFGVVVPVSDASYALAVAQCFLGVLLNVFLFTFVITKFQRPLAHVLYADKVALCTRGGEQFVLFRIANLRCNTLHRPEVTLTLLRRRTTPEGEEFISRSRLEVHEPPVTLTAVTTISYKVEDVGPGSAFMNLTQGAVDSGALSDVLLQVVVTAYDPIYDADVCAMKVYDASHFAFDSHFAGVMSSDKNGESVINFDAIHDVVPQRRKIFRALAENSPSPRLDAPATELELVLGAGRGARGPDFDTTDIGPRSALEMVCGYCVKVLLVVNEAKVPFTHYMSDISTPDDKPYWLELVNPKKEAPVARLPGETEWVAGSDAIVEALRNADERVAEVVERRRRDDATAISPNDQTFLKQWTLVWILAVITPPAMTIAEALEKGGMLGFLMTSIGLSAEPEEEAMGLSLGSVRVREAAAAKAEAYFTTLERVTSVRSPLDLEAGPPPFLCGELPGVLDFWVAPDLVLMLEPELPKFLGAHGIDVALGPSARAWLRRVCALDHFRSRCGAGSGDGMMAMVSVIVGKLEGFAQGPDAINVAAVHELLRGVRLKHPPAPMPGSHGEEDTGVTEDPPLGSATPKSLRSLPRRSSTNAKLCV